MTNNMSEPRCWWLAKSVSDDHDTLTAYNVDGDDEDWMATKGIYVIEKSAVDKLVEKYQMELVGKVQALETKLKIVIEAMESLDQQLCERIIDPCGYNPKDESKESLIISTLALSDENQMSLDIVRKALAKIKEKRK